MNLTDRAVLATITRAADTTGAKLPKPLLEAQATADRVRGNAVTVTATDEQIAAAVSRVLATDSDPAADPEVQRLVTARFLGMNGISNTVETTATEELRTVVAQHRDAILGAFQGPYATAAAALAAAAPVLGNIDLTDTGAVLSAGPKAAEAWATTKRALDVVDACVQVLYSVSEFSRTVSLPQAMTPLRYAAIGWDEWVGNQLGQHDRKVKAWDLVRAGIPLSLPTLTEYAERVAVITAGQRLAESEAERLDTLSLTGRV